MTRGKTKLAANVVIDVDLEPRHLLLVFRIRPKLACNFIRPFCSLCIQMAMPYNPYPVPMYIDTIYDDPIRPPANGKEIVPIQLQLTCTAAHPTISIHIAILRLYLVLCAYFWL